MIKTIFTGTDQLLFSLKEDFISKTVEFFYKKFNANKRAIENEISNIFIFKFAGFLDSCAIFFVYRI